MDDVLEEDDDVAVVEEVSEGELAREAVDDWAFVVGALRLTRPV